MDIGKLINKLIDMIANTYIYIDCMCVFMIYVTFNNCLNSPVNSFSDLSQRLHTWPRVEAVEESVSTTSPRTTSLLSHRDPQTMEPALLPIAATIPLAHMAALEVPHTMEEEWEHLGAMAGMGDTTDLEWEGRWVQMKMGKCPLSFHWFSRSKKEVIVFLFI